MSAVDADPSGADRSLPGNRMTLSRRCSALARSGTSSAWTQALSASRRASVHHLSEQCLAQFVVGQSWRLQAEGEPRFRASCELAA
jgi:hypothetical protein